SRPRDPQYSAEVEPLRSLRGARWGTASGVSRTPTRFGSHLLAHVEGARVPPACPAEWIFLVISVLLCRLTEGTNKARTREISRIRASDQAFQPGLLRKLLEVPILVL